MEEIHPAGIRFLSCQALVALPIHSEVGLFNPGPHGMAIRSSPNGSSPD